MELEITGRKEEVRRLFLDIVIPCLNEAKNLSLLLPHLLTSPKKQLPASIYIADSPLSNQAQTIPLDNKNIFYVKCSQTGRAQQMNEAAQLGDGEVILFLHADVTPPTDYISHIKKVVEDGYEAGFFCYQFDPSNQLLNINAATTKSANIFSGGGDQCQFMTRKLFEKLGGYNEHYCIMEDFEMYDRWRRLGIEFKIIQEPALVSSRKYKKNNYLKVNLINGLTLLQYKCGRSPQKLKQFYSKFLNS